jgi:hypothetical protein
MPVQRLALTGKCPASPALQGRVPAYRSGKKGHNIKGNTFPGSAALRGELHFCLVDLEFLKLVAKFKLERGCRS